MVEEVSVIPFFVNFLYPIISTTTLYVEGAIPVISNFPLISVVVDLTTFPTSDFKYTLTIGKVAFDCLSITFPLRIASAAKV